MNEVIEILGETLLLLVSGLAGGVALGLLGGFGTFATILVLDRLRPKSGVGWAAVTGPVVVGLLAVGPGALLTAAAVAWFCPTGWLPFLLAVAVPLAAALLAFRWLTRG